MCGRFELESNIYALQSQLGLEFEDIRSLQIDGMSTDTPADAQPGDHPEDHPSDSLETAFDSLSGTRRPTERIVAVLPDRKPATRRWGLVAPGMNAPLINARAETLAQKPTFRPLLERRCLIPATGWYEWRSDGKVKHKNRITLPDFQPFLFAGLENGKEAAIITCAPSAAIAHIHDRMPAVIGPNHLAGWLDPHLSFRQVRHMLGPLPDHVLSWQESPSTSKEDTKRNDLFAD